MIQPYNPATYKGISYLGDGWLSPASTANIIYLARAYSSNSNSYYVVSGYNDISCNGNTVLLRNPQSVVATAVSQEMEILLVAGNINATGYVKKKYKSDNNDFNIYKALSNFNVNVRGLAWSPDAQLFCLCGKKEQRPARTAKTGKCIQMPAHRKI